jgi:hypothetical protein
MAENMAPADRSPRGWRRYRRRRRAPSEQRRSAQSALANLLQPHKLGWILAGLLAASVLVHGFIVPYVYEGQGASADMLAANESNYLARVMRRQLAKKTAKEIKGRVTMPPPPPEPEAVVSDTLNRGVTSDIEKIVGDLLDADVTAGLAKQVRVSLKEELDLAAKDIADGKLSEKEIQQLQEDMRSAAHTLTVAALKTHRIKTQVKRAQISVTAWYEKDVSRNLMGNIRYAVFNARHRGGIWYKVYSGSYFGQFDQYCNWSQAKGMEYLRKKIGSVSSLASGRHGWPPKTLSTWPRPSAELAAIYHSRLSGLYRYGPSWRALMHGGFDKHQSGTKVKYQHMTQGVLEEFFPHRRDTMLKPAETADAAWTDAIEAAGAYRAKAQGGASEAELKPAHDACVQKMKALASAMQRLSVGDRTYRLVNSIVRSQVLRGAQRERVYERLVAKLTEGLAPLIKDFAIGQFEEGIIKWDKSAESAMDEFPKMITPLLRRDIRKLFGKQSFDKYVFNVSYPDRGYRSAVTGERRYRPSPADAKVEDALLAKTLAGNKSLQAYAGKRREILTQHFEKAIDRVTEMVLSRVLSEGLMFRDLSAFVEGVDYADKVQEKFDARQRALDGRGQDLARLTKDGVPDTSAARYALLWGGAKGHGANLLAQVTSMRPAYFARTMPETVLHTAKPIYPPKAAPWGLERQVDAAKVRPKFKPAVRRFEAIPFVAQFPAFDGKLGDMAKLRPIVLKSGSGEPILLYAAWNYQGFLFYYEVRQPDERFYFPTAGRAVRGGAKIGDAGWAYAGDHCRMLFDTLDARNKNRGEPHTQEFVILPRGSDTNPFLPGIERLIESQRDAVTKEYRGVKSKCKVYPSQPPPGHNPDGSGPHRVTRFEKDHYAVEVFVPRSLFNVPVFAPGWLIGFDCSIGIGAQSSRRFRGKHWVGGDANRPDLWGDLLLLGTDPKIIVYEGSTRYPIAQHMTPGYSYLVHVEDPDRNVYLAAEDTIIVSAEVRGGNNDVEVFTLRETGKNTGVFRGYVNTQPGRGREVQGVLEIMPGDKVRLGYVDFANANGKRNVIYEVNLPVAAPVTRSGE